MKYAKKTNKQTKQQNAKTKTMTFHSNQSVTFLAFNKVSLEFVFKPTTTSSSSNCTLWCLLKNTTNVHDRMEITGFRESHFHGPKTSTMRLRKIDRSVSKSFKCVLVCLQMTSVRRRNRLVVVRFFHRIRNLGEDR